MADFLKEFEDQQTKSLKGRQKTFDRQVKTIEKSALGEAKTEENKLTIKDVISQITSAMNVGSKPKREDFIDAAKELSNIQSALSEVGASDSLSFDSELLKKLQEAVQVGLDFIAEQKPSLKGAAAKGIANKMKETSTGFVKNMAMETVSGIPFGAAVVDWMGAKMSGFGESLTQGKKLTETELGIGRAFAPETAEVTEDIVEDATEEAAKKETAKSNGGTSTTLRRRSGDLADIPTAGGTVATNGNGGGLAETNEILKDILLAVTPDAEAQREAERERELERLEDQKGAKQVGIQKGDEKGLFGDFNFMDIFKKGGFKKVIASLGGTLLSGMTTAFGSTGMVGKGLLTKMGPALMKVAGPAALLAGITMAITDGVKGYANSEEWGVSKFSGTLGGILGGEDKGLKGAMWGGMKWALIGAGIGSVFPVVGTLIGGALGALLGAILGYFGGEKIAKAIDKMGKWFDEKWNGFLSIFGLGDDKVTAEAQKKAAKGQLEIDKKKLEMQDADIAKMEAEGVTEDDSSEGKKLTRLKARRGRLAGKIKEKEISAGPGGSGLSQKQRDKELKELSASKEDTEGLFKGSVKGIEESEADLSRAKIAHEAEIEILKKKRDDAMKGISPFGWGVSISEEDESFDVKTETWIAHVDRDIKKANEKFKEQEVAHKWMLDRKALLEKENLAAKDAGLASGGFIVNRPTYLPSSGVIVGESKGYSGGGLAKALDGPPEMIIQGAAGGMLQSGGGPTQVYPLGGPQKEKTEEMFQPIAKSIAGATINQMAMDRVGMRGPAGMGSAPTIIDASTVQNVSNNTLVRPPSPGGQLMHREKEDFVHKIA